MRCMWWGIYVRCMWCVCIYVDMRCMCVHICRYEMYVMRDIRTMYVMCVHMCRYVMYVMCVYTDVCKCESTRYAREWWGIYVRCMYTHIRSLAEKSACWQRGVRTCVSAPCVCTQCVCVCTCDDRYVYAICHTYQRCVCVCVCTRARVRVRACVRVCVSMSGNTIHEHCSNRCLYWFFFWYCLLPCACRHLIPLSQNSPPPVTKERVWVPLHEHPGKKKR